MSIKFVFIAVTVITIFASSSVLMSLISTGTSTVNQEVSDKADQYSRTFLATTLFLVFVSVIVMILLGSKKSPF